jgi:hypothetical protein
MCIALLINILSENLFFATQATGSMPLFNPNFLQNFFPLVDQHSRFLLTFVALHELHRSFFKKLLSKELGHLVKLKSINWFSKFSRFSLTKFDEKRWLENFHMNKTTLFNIAYRLQLDP